MRKLILLVALVVGVPAAAGSQERSEIQGFGGVSVGSSSFGSAASSTFGGSISLSRGTRNHTSSPAATELNSTPGKP